ncbi:AAA family ATPase, partial [Nostoc sp. NMS4]|uniref:AAA family ATPase n=1 Tax=Nostoc sp. NMS4 TaxID=2815390 RepID=UPI0025EFCE6B
KQVKLIDFSIASLLPKETQEIKNLNVLEGTLAYISPEQTGRMNRLIDYRTDFYSLGVTFYELLTGELPFPSNDAMELVHCHIAKMPDCVSDMKSEIPKVVGEIIRKLMAKNAEDRYQSALGLKHDLEKCLSQLEETGGIESFEIAQRDICDRFIIPDKLYGREAEVETLLSSFERVSLGATEMMLVAGFSGIGKTAVVNELHKPIVRQRGYFIKGKYDQFQRNIPFSAFVQAFRDLMGQLLTESDAQIQAWKNQILAAVGESGQVIIEVIPELEIIIGKQPPATELSGTAAENRFNLLFQKFTQVFTSFEHPLVMFLDDLQWADSASLKLIQLLMADTGHLFLIGAYRDNEVNLAHPLMLTLGDIEKTAVIINTITLASLNQDKVNELVADTLKCTENLALPFSQLVYEKTQGNPFFATQFIKALYQDGLIKFNFELGCWQCDIAQATQQAVTDDVVQFMALQLQKLPESTQEVLKLAACIGNQFDLATLAIISEKSEIETAVDLWTALQEGLILPQSEVYKFYQGEDNQQLGLENRNTNKQLAKYRFLHDRVQQAAYSLIPDEQKQATHLKIGQLLLRNSANVERDERLFEIVNQLNTGRSLIVEQAEQIKLAQLNLIAGLKAKTSTAYTTAADYLKTGTKLVGLQGWQHSYKLTFSFYRQLAEVEFLCGNFDQSVELVEQILSRAKDVSEQAEVYNLLVVQYTFVGQYAAAIETGMKALQLLGIDISKGDLQAEIQQEIQTINNYLQQHSVLSLLDDLSETTDPKIRIAVQLLVNLDPPVYITSNLDLYILISAKIVALSLEYGYIPETVKGYGNYGWLSGIVLGDYKTGYDFGVLGMSLAHKLNNRAQISKVSLSFGSWIHSWSKPVGKILHVNDEGYQAGLESGEVLFGGFNLFCKVTNQLFSGTSLDIIDENLHKYLPFATKTKNGLLFGVLGGVYFLVQGLLGSTTASSNSSKSEGEIQIDRQQYLEFCETGQDFCSLSVFYIWQMQLSCINQTFRDGLNYALAAKRTLKGALGFTPSSEYPIYESLILLNLYQEAAPDQQAQYLQQVWCHQLQYKVWVDNCPENFLHKYLLVEAELHRVMGETLKAVEFYDRAITSAKEHNFTHIEALANEFAARFYVVWGRERIAQDYLLDAYYAYARWGAKAKTDDLEKRYPQLLLPILQQPKPSFNVRETLTSLHTNSIHSSTQVSSSSIISDMLDFDSVIKAAQALSGTIQLDELLQQLTQIILQNSGGDKCILVLPQDEIWYVRAISTPEITELCSQALENHPNVPIKLIQYVKRTQTVVAIDNLATDLPVIDDYLSQRQPKSVLCLPILNQGHLAGILCLKNQATAGVFTSDRLKVINFLCTQAAISLENAGLYQESQYYNQQLQQSLQDLQKVQEKVQETEKLFQAMADSAPVLLWLAGTDSLCYFFNQIWLDFTGRTLEQEMGNGWAEGVHPEDFQQCLDIYLTSFHARKSFKMEYRLKRADGEYRWILGNGTPRFFPDGSFAGYVGSCIDITDRKLIEADHQKKSEALQQALQELQTTQIQMIQSEKMSALGNLVAGIAHEMNNPLGFISASLKQAKPSFADISEHLKLYQKSLPNPSDEIIDHAEEIDLDYSLEDLPKMIDSMSMACDRLKNISTSLRTFSRADQDYKVPFNIHSGIDSTILILKHRIKANEQRPAIEVVTNYGDLPQIECFPGQLNQVFMNLIANAIDAIDESNQGRIFEEIKANPNCITITTSFGNNLVKIAIADNGKGMSEEVKSKIFDHLFTTKAVGKGTGLGLAIARQIVVEKHNGSLVVNSTLGEGTEFVITLPGTSRK